MRIVALVLIGSLLLLKSVNADELLIHNLRVGQGDATLIQGPIQTDGTRVNVLVDAGDIPQRDGGDIIRAVLWKKKVNTLDYLIITPVDADHLGVIAFGGRHGESFLLGFNDVPSAVGDVQVLHFVDYGQHNMRGTTQAIKKYNRFANAMGDRIGFCRTKIIYKAFRESNLLEKNVRDKKQL